MQSHVTYVFLVWLIKNALWGGTLKWWHEKKDRRLRKAKRQQSYMSNRWSSLLHKTHHISLQYSYFHISRIVKLFWNVDYPSSFTFTWIYKRDYATPKTCLALHTWFFTVKNNMYISLEDIYPFKRMWYFNIRWFQAL